MTVGGRRVEVSRPRIRTADDERELPVKTYGYFADRDPLAVVVVNRMLAGVSTRKYASVGEPVGERVCRGVPVLPDDHTDYLRGRRRPAHRTNLRRAEAAGIWCEPIDDPHRAFDGVTEIVEHRRTPLSHEERCILSTWPELLTGPGMTLVVPRDELGCPLAITGAVIDDTDCLIRLAVARCHDARWALHDHLVRILIERGVTYLLAEGGGPFGALGFDANVTITSVCSHMSDHAPWRARPERMKMFVRRWPGTPGAVEMSDGRFGRRRSSLVPASPIMSVTRESRAPRTVALST